MEMEHQLAEEEENDKTEDPKQAGTLTTKDLSEAFQLLDRATAIFTEKDPQRERSAKVNRMITSAYSCYMEIYEQKKKHARQQTLNGSLSHNKSRN
ncbi:hypothetical protein M514_15756 [Trichuris suis]|uniref:Uncharacterized protein n=1 Tax=Trichuris suis TaxID=68888 RepID=A0A085NRF8_9BILA|nr:hypothetical protein M514_15756 [Trichuris suis]